MSWQPIETAQKDGSFVDLWADEDCPDSNYYQGRVADCTFNAARGRFESVSGWGQVFPVKNPTHWMPLPEPPK